jgi:hypothetical protein
VILPGSSFMHFGYGHPTGASRVFDGSPRLHAIVVAVLIFVRLLGADAFCFVATVAAPVLHSS